MKKLFFLAISLIAFNTYAQEGGALPPPKTTTFTRQFLLSTNSSQANLILGNGSGSAASTLIGWTASGAYQMTNATYDSYGIISSAALVWPDSTTGAYTTLTANTNFLTVDAYEVSSAGVYVIQPLVSRDSNGNVTNKPALVYSTVSYPTYSWAAQVAAVGGTYTTNELAAVDTFMTEIAPYKSSIQRFNAFVGDYNAAFVPLIATVGYPVDTNVGFASTNFSRTAGFTATGGVDVKYLKTGAGMTAFQPTNGVSAQAQGGDFHMAIRVNNKENPSANGRTLLGTLRSDSTGGYSYLGISGNVPFAPLYFSDSAQIYAQAAVIDTNLLGDFWFARRRDMASGGTPIRTEMITSSGHTTNDFGFVYAALKTNQFYVFLVNYFASNGNEATLGQATNTLSCYSVGKSLVIGTNDYEPAYRIAVNRLMDSLGRVNNPSLTYGAGTQTNAANLYLKLSTNSAYLGDPITLTATNSVAIPGTIAFYSVTSSRTSYVGRALMVSTNIALSLPVTAMGITNWQAVYLGNTTNAPYTNYNVTTFTVNSKFL